MEKISRRQLFCLITMGQIGSTNLWALGIEAKQDAWIAALLSMIMSLGFVWVFTELHKNYPNDNIAGLLTSLLGKVIGWPLAFIYAMLFLFNATRNSSEFGDLIKMTFLENTPRNVIVFMFLATIIYILFLRIETLVRLIEIILPSILFIIIAVYVMIIISGRVDLSNLKPVLGNGIMPVIKATYPVGVNFPFAMVFTFMQFWHFSDPKHVRKTTLTAIFVSVIFLMMSLIVIVCVLGVNVAADATIPLLEVIRLINIADIVTNMDAVGVILIFTGGFYMATLYFLAACLILSTLFKVNDYRWFLIPLGILILLYTNVYEPNYPFHVKYLVPQFWQQFVPLFNIIPVLLLFIFWMKNYIKNPERKL